MTFPLANRPDTSLQHVDSGRDAFDIGEQMPTSLSRQNAVDALQSPDKFIQSLNLNPDQAANLRSLIVAGGTGAVHRLLSKHLGDDVSAVIGALASAWIVKKIDRR